MALANLRDATFEQLAELMREKLGVDLAKVAKSRVASQLAPRLRRLGMDSCEAYVALIAGEDDGGEFEIAVDLLTTRDTCFFREPAQFDHLESELSLLRPQRLRLWSAASSFGDEAYSLAMLLADLQQAGRIGADWSVLGTDISERALRSAAQALYPEDRLRHATTDRLKRYGLRGGNSSAGLVQMQASLRERVHFERHDLRAPLHGALGFDAIWLRQGLSYFDATTRHAVLAQVLARLHPGGLFFVGIAEEALVATPGLASLGSGVFRKMA